MTKEKKIIYGIVISIFIVIWFLYFLIVKQSIKEDVKNILPIWIKTTSQQLTTVISQKQDKFKKLVSDQSVGDNASVAQIKTLLTRLNEKKEGSSHVIYIDKHNNIYSVNGITYSKILDTEAFQRVKQQGYAITEITNKLTQEANIGFIIPAHPSSEMGYFVQVEPKKLFVDNLLDSISIKFDYIELFDRWGSALSFVLLSEKSRVYLQDSLDTGAMSFVQKTDTSYIKKLDFSNNYNVFIRLQEPQGWFIGAYVSEANILPLHTTSLKTSITIFISSAFIMCLIFFLDIFNDRKNRREFHKISRTDYLTRLTNAFGMEDEIIEFLKGKDAKQYSLVSIDIAAFHQFNTIFDYSAGDNLLRVIASFLKKNYFASARSGADVFTFLTKNTSNMLQQLEKDLFTTIKNDLGRQYIQMLSFNIGVYPILDDDYSFKEIYEGAQLALKDAKKDPLINWVVYGKELQKRMDLQVSIEMNMLHALSKEEFAVYIQPKYSIKNHCCAGGEALIRWSSEQIGFLYPDQFISIFEKNGFIVEIDFFVLATIFQTLDKDLKEGYKVYPISVNQSRITITFPNYLDRLKNLINRYPNVPLEYIELEITETAFKKDYKRITHIVYAIKDLGFAVDLDDFGTGYSSLNTLRELPVDVLKIDKTFLYETDNSNRSKKIIKNIVNMSKELNIKVLCEGAETQGQYEFLEAIHCDYIQGFYYSKPIPLAEYEAKYIKKIADDNS